VQTNTKHALIFNEMELFINILHRMKNKDIWLQCNALRDSLLTLQAMLT